MNLRTILVASSAAAVLAGCGGQNASSGGYGGFDSSLGRGANTFGPNNPNSPAPVPNVAAWPSESGVPVLVKGVNLPVFEGQEGHDLGKNPFSPKDEVWYKAEAVDKQFQDLSDIGFNVVRVFLFEKGEGLKVSKDGYVTGLDETFSKNLSDMVERGRAHKLRVYLSFTEGWPEGLKNPVLDKKAMDAYFKHAVAPITRQFKSNDGVFAFDLITGVEALTTPTGKDAKAATWEQVQKFVKAGVELIKKQDPERLLTVGNASIAAVGKAQYANLGLDFYDVKHMDDKGDMPIAKDLKLDRPILVGSFGQAASERSDEIQTSSIKAFVLSAPLKGYAGYLFSNYGYKDSKDIQSLIGPDGKARPALEALKTVMKEVVVPPAGK
ncbi:MAG: cellulase family glycosylhydrolase [Fimbriimonas sp.]